MEMRYIVIALSILAIVGILGDLWFRRRRAMNAGRVAVAQAEKPSPLSEAPLDDFPYAELPSGGARVRPVTPEEVLALDTKFKFKTRVPILMDSVETLPEVEHKAKEQPSDNPQQSLNFDQELPQVPEPAPVTAASRPASGLMKESSQTEPVGEPQQDDNDFPPITARRGEDDDSDNEAPWFEVAEAGRETAEESDEHRSRQGSKTAAEQHRDRRTPSRVPAEPNVLDEPNSPLLDPANLASPEDSDWEWEEPFGTGVAGNTADQLMALDDIGQPSLRQRDEQTDEAGDQPAMDVFANPPPGQDLLEPDEVIVINVVADSGLIFAGDQLLEIALACGMRFGAMDIFHRTDNTGRLQFSMASCTKPGTFDIDAISEATVSGVSLFMTLPCSSDAMQSFEYMAETANVLARHLKGVMKDESHNVMRGQTLEHCRNRIREYARSQMLNH